MKNEVIKSKEQLEAIIHSILREYEYIEFAYQGDATTNAVSSCFVEIVARDINFDKLVEINELYGIEVHCVGVDMESDDMMFLQCWIDSDILKLPLI